MTATARFGLTLNDALSDHDKVVTDTLLAAYEVHDHKGGERLADPTEVPVGILAPTGGKLQAGQTFYYVASFIDKYGLETAGSAEFSVTTALAMAPPNSPVLTTTTGGTLPVGVTYYAVSAVDIDGNETRLSNPATITISDYNTVLVDASALDVAAVSLRVWRQGPHSGGLYTNIGQVAVEALPFSDNGSVPDDEDADATQLNTSNATNGTSKVVITVPQAVLVGAAVSPVKAWRLYRSLQSSAYPASSLVTEVRTTVSPGGTGGLRTTFTDDGTVALAAGTPLLLSQTLRPSVKIVSGGGGGALVLATGAGNRRIVCDASGTLVTRPSGGYVDSQAGSSYLLSDPSRVSWRLGMSDDGSLTTTAGLATDADTVYLPGSGPGLPGPDPTVSYVLGVTDDGSLTTTEV